MTCLKQDIAEAEADYAKASGKVTEAERELRRLETTQRQVKKETQKIQPTTRDLVRAENKVSLGEMSRRMGQPALDRSREEIIEALTAATSGMRVFSMKEVKGLQIFNYDGAMARHFDGRVVKGGEVKTNIEAAMMRRECRGLVVGRSGIVARPMHKFFEEGQVMDTRYDQVANARVLDARQKLDGTMVFGVVHPTERWVELWTRTGPTEPAKGATRFAESGAAGDILGLVECLDIRGLTACFEWVGWQRKIKEVHNDTELVMTQVRHKTSGEYMEWESMKAWAVAHGVRCAEWAGDLVGKTVDEASAMVMGRKDVEGVVVRIQGGGC